MKKFGVFLVLILAAAGMAVGGWWLYSEVIRPLLDPPGLSLEDLDRALDRQDWTMARTLLSRAAEKTESMAQGRELLPRALRLARNHSDHWDLYLNLASRLRTQFPGSAQAAFFQAYGYLRSGQYSEAGKLLPGLEDLSRSSTDLDPNQLGILLREIRVRTELTYEGREADPSLEMLTAALRDFRQNPELYQGLQTLVEDKGILQNTLLLYLREGRYTEVLNLLGRDRGGLRTPLLKALIYYDSARWEQALDALKTLEGGEEDLQYNLLLADLTMHLSGSEAAAVVYWRMVREDATTPLKPLQSSPIPYLNLATLLEERGNELSLKEARNLLEMTGLDGMVSMDADMRDLSTLFRLELDFRLGGISAVSQKLLQNGLSPDEEILRYRLMPEYLALPRLHLLSKNTSGPVFHRVSEALVWNLLLVQDYEKALDTLQKWETSQGGASWWSSYYRGILHSLMQDPQRAQKDLLEVPPRWRDFGYYYNLGLVSWALDTPEGRTQALKYWEEGRNSLSGMGIRSLREKDVLFSKLYQRLALAFEAAGDLEKAREYSSLAKRLDDSNHSAYFLEKRLLTDEDLINDEIEEPGTD